VQGACSSRETDLANHLDEVQLLALRGPAEWMRASGEVQGLLMCLLEPTDLDELCDSRGIGGFQRPVLQEFCGDQIARGLASCPTEEHHHCCSCHSNDYPLRPDDGHCCADCTETCSGALSALPIGDLCDGVSGECDLIAFMRAVMDTLGTEDLISYASAHDLVAPDKLGVFCACRAVGTKMILQGGPEREAAEAVQGDACLPDDHPAGGDTVAYEAGPCSTGVHVNLDAPPSLHEVSIGDSSGYPAGPSECRWSISCPAGWNPSLSFNHFMMDSHSLGRVAANGDLAAERDMAGECNPGEPSIEDFNNPSLYGPDSRENLPEIHWEIATATPATTRNGVDVSAVRTTATWQHLDTTLVAGVWQKTEGSTWLHDNTCYELHFESDGFGITIRCSGVDPAVPPPDGPYTLHFKSYDFRCKPFEGRGDYIRYAFGTFARVALFVRLL
jgi:hypothetical protein